MNMSTTLTVLVVDDETSIRNIFTDIVAKKAEDVLIHTASDGVEGLQKITATAYDVAFIDVRMPRMGGLELLEQAKKIRPDIEVIIFTAQASIEDAVRAIKMGASDYVAKPFRIAEILLVLDKIRRHLGLKDENKMLKEQLQDRFNVSNMIGMTSQMEKVNELVDKVRLGDMAVLITGESG
ncbi:MAG: hypothetical protein A2W23_03330 [Planctomycetes bacterium RBG_16_43_13]|nr:MAG: hypothetical protein A2W23_03330 [Planctomycetes bacterium RBG_16_43_13]